MRFWDASALVPLLVDEPRTQAARALVAQNPEMVVWWGTDVECSSAVARRSGGIDSEEQIEALKHEWRETGPGETAREMARRAVRVHRLRAGDAFQLAAALLAADGDPQTLPFVTLDHELARAAALEGFPVIQPGQ